MNVLVDTPPLVTIEGVARNAAVERVGDIGRRYTVAAPFFLREPAKRDVVQVGDERVVITTVTWDKYRQTATIEGDVSNG